MFNPNTRILIVDDASTMRKMIIKMVKELGFADILEAENGAQAWELIASSKPEVQLVISDWNMPVSTGLDLLKRVRADSRFGKMPFMLVTAEAEPSQVTAAVASGVDNYVVKPFSKTDLLAKLQVVYKKWAA